MTAPPVAILFDLDDTILASGRRPEALLRVAREHAAELGDQDPAALAARLERDFAEFWSDPARHKIARFDMVGTRRKVVAGTFEAIGAPGLTRDLAHRFADRFNACRDQMTELFPGARTAIETLKARGVRLALVTNGAAEVQRAKIDRFALEPLFQHIQIEGEHGFGKPEDRAYLHAMSALGVEAHETWMVGDHLEWEVAAPQRLGLRAVWCDPFGEGLPAGSTVRPDRIVRSLMELVD